MPAGEPRPAIQVERLAGGIQGAGGLLRGLPGEGGEKGFLGARGIRRGGRLDRLAERDDEEVETGYGRAVVGAIRLGEALAVVAAAGRHGKRWEGGEEEDQGES